MSQEHGGNDPSTQVVPSNGSGWKQAEDAPVASPAERASSLTSGSNWATSQPPRGGPPLPWTPGAPAPPPHPYGPPPRASYPGEPRGLNPKEYPSLAATAKTAAAGGKGPRTDEPQDNRAWADDERAPPGPGLGHR